MRLAGALAWGVFFLLPISVHAQPSARAGGELVSSGVWLAALLALVPFVLVATTSFMKLAIVFSILRNALGLGQVPSGLVITVLAALLTAFVMAPVAREAGSASAGPLARVDWAAPLAAHSRDALLEAVDRAREPLRAFFDHNAGRSERSLFAGLARRTLPEAERQTVQESDFSVVLPAFFLTELAEAFQIGFLLLLPFLVVDLVVTSILATLGMQALSPAVVSLPFKLLLFVSVDGFGTLIEALLAGYR